MILKILVLFSLFFVNAFAVTESECNNITSNGGATWDSSADTCDCVVSALSADNSCECSQSGYVWDEYAGACVDPAVKQQCESITNNGGTVFDDTSQTCMCTHSALSIDNQCNCADSNQVWSESQNACIDKVTCDIVETKNLSDATADCKSQNLTLDKYTCSDNSNGITFSHTCKSLNCPDTQEAVNGVCVDKCASGYSRQSDGTCSPKSCPDGQYLDDTGACVAYPPIGDSNKITPKQYIASCSQYCFTGTDGVDYAVNARQAPVSTTNIISIDTLDDFMNYCSWVLTDKQTYPNSGNEEQVYSYTLQCDFGNVLLDTFQYYSKSVVYHFQTETDSQKNHTDNLNSSAIDYGNGVNWKIIGGMGVDYCGEGNLKTCDNTTDTNSTNNGNGISDSDLSALISNSNAIKNNISNALNKLSGIDSKISTTNNKLSGIDSKISTTNNKLSSIDGTLKDIKDSVSGSFSSGSGDSALNSVKGYFQNDFNVSKDNNNSDSNDTNPNHIADIYSSYGSNSISKLSGLFDNIDYGISDIFNVSDDEFVDINFPPVDIDSIGLHLRGKLLNANFFNSLDFSFARLIVLLVTLVSSLFYVIDRLFH